MSAGCKGNGVGELVEIADLDLVARSLACLAEEEPEDLVVGLVHVTLRRAHEARVHMARAGRPHPRFGDGSIRSAHRSVARDVRRAAVGGRPAYYRALALAAAVLARDRADPTHGAMAFHHHRDNPEWARWSEPVALIGSFLFYRLGALPAA